MREIKFRARRMDDTIHNGKWVYGHYFTPPLTDENSGLPSESGWFFLSGAEERHCIEQDGVVYTIDPDTLGQYTGLRDTNGNEIYEGDNCLGGTLRCQDGYEIINDRACTVHFHEGVFMVGSISLCSINRYTSVVGNVYENSDLVGGCRAMQWLDEIEQKLKAAKPLPPFAKPNDKVDLAQLHANAVFANDSLVMVANLIAAVKMAEKALGYFERGSFVNDSASSGYAKHIRAKLQSGDFQTGEESK